MPTNLAGRFFLIFAVLILSLWAIFPSGNPRKPDLKPGIDLVGGTKLLYQIKTPPGTSQSGLSEQVMDALKKRVDPDGVRNLVWRPQDGARLEIQMPLSKTSDEAKAKREAFSKAQATLESANIRAGEVNYAIEDLSGDARAEKLKGLAHGSDIRANALANLAGTWDQIQQARQRKDAPAQAKLEEQYETVIAALLATNVTPGELQAVLDLKNAQTRQQKLDNFKKIAANNPQQLAAVDGFIAAYADYAKVKGGLDDAGDLKRLLRGSGVLEFHILVWTSNDSGLRLDPTMSEDEYRTLVDRLKARGPAPQAGDTTRWYVVDNPEEFHYPTVEFNEKNYVLAFITKDKALTHGPGQPQWTLERASPQMANGEMAVAFGFDAMGARLFGELTGNNIGKALAIVLDDKIVSAPNINSAIYDNGQITGGRGGFSKTEMDYLVNTLNAGALPAQLNDEPISEETVGPQLGEDNRTAGLRASVIGLCVVAVFIIVYYHLAGVVAVIALVMNMIIILGVMAAYNATWTLPAIAGIVLTIGMSIDANVLVFERLREETARGLSLRLALKNAYDRAFSAIVDSNAVTAVTCVILYYIGSEEVKGFGLTLLIGLISSLFTALYVTKTLFAWLLDTFHIETLGSLPTTFPAFGRALVPNVDWMSKSKYFLAGSIALIVAGTVALTISARRGELFDIEFSSGTSVQFDLKDATPIGEVRKLFAAAPESELPSPTIVSVGANEKTYEVVTPSNDSRRVQSAVLAALAGQLNIVTPSNFDGADADLTAALDHQVLPITPDTKTIAGMSPVSLRTNVGGVAVVLKNLSPPLSAEEIKARLDPTALPTGTNPQYAAVDVQTPQSGPSDTAVIITSDPSAAFDPNDSAKRDQWTQALAKPLWSSVQYAIHSPPQLSKVSNFNPQVAGEMQQNAFIALGLSLLVIMVYIWLRFGNFKYGTATVLAMLHDTLAVIGAIGISHFIGRTYFGSEFLLVEPFRVNLTLVAAVLTVMSYSMVDTIVVFDRIRENRGRFGALTPALLNASINQTLSRTILTAGTTTITSFVMYVFGGAGVHGFTFVLLIGILVGTYSSIAIAAPILLLGEAAEASAARRGNAPGQRQLQGA